MSKGFTIFLGTAEVAGGLGVAFGVFAQLAAFGIIALMLRAMRRNLLLAHRILGRENLRLALRSDVHPDRSGDLVHGRRTVCAAEVSKNLLKFVGLAKARFAP